MLHGLWPNNWTGKQPSDCTPTKFQLSSMTENDQKEIVSYWNCLYGNQEAYVGHEWAKHGTCWNKDIGNLSKMPENVRDLLKVYRKSGMTDSPQEYVEFTIGLAKIYNFYDALAESGILPNNSITYKVNSMLEAMKKKYKVQKFSIYCNLKEGKSYFFTLRICLDFEYKPIDCASTSLRSCKEDIIYPEFNF